MLLKLFNIIVTWFNLLTQRNISQARYYSTTLSCCSLEFTLNSSESLVKQLHFFYLCFQLAFPLLFFLTLGGAPNQALVFILEFRNLMVDRLWC